jgi:hypothetical protein
MQKRISSLIAVIPHPRTVIFCSAAILLTSAGLYFIKSASVERTRLNRSAYSGTMTLSPRVPFVENRGQHHSSVRYTASTFSGTVSVTEKGEIVYTLPYAEKGHGAKQARQGRKGSKPGMISQNSKVGRVPGGSLALKETCINAATSSITSGKPAPTKVNYFIGNDPGLWKRNVNTCEEVNFSEIYRGITLTLRATGHNVEKIFTVTPGSDPGQIKLSLEGGSATLRVTEKGELAVDTPHGEVLFTKPLAFQVKGGEREYISAEYSVRGNEYGFTVAEYDRERDLVIDPLLASSYAPAGYAGMYSAVDPATGNIFLTGATYDGGSDYGIKVVRMRPKLSWVDHETYINGVTGWDFPSSIDLYRDNSNTLSVYISGYTKSSDFPVTSGAYDTTFNTSELWDIFIVKLTEELDATVATYLGGENWDGYEGFRNRVPLKVDSGGYVYIGGTTASADFPVTPGAFNSLPLSGNRDIFISKFNPDLSGGSLAASTIIRANSTNDALYDLVVDDNYVYITGNTYSVDYPCTPEALQKSNLGENDAMVSVLSKDLGSLIASTYIGGSLNDYAYSIYTANGSVYISGETNSANFPVTAGVYDTTYNGAQDLFLVKLNPDMSLAASTFLGTAEDDLSRYPSLAHDSKGNIYFTGHTYSTVFPVAPGAYSTVSGGERDAFIAKFDGNLTKIITSTYLGGISAEIPFTLFIHNNAVYISGGTGSSDFPTTTGAWRQAPATQGFITIIDLFLSAAACSPESAVFGNMNVYTQSDEMTFTITNMGRQSFTFATISLTGANSSDFIITEDNCSGNPLVKLAACTVKTAFYPKSKGTKNALLSIPATDGVTTAVVRELTLTGSGVNSTITVSPSAHDFGQVVMNKSETITFTVTNIGQRDLTINGTTIVGSGFSIKGESLNDAVILPQQSREITIQFMPETSGSQKGAMMIQSNDPSAPVFDVPVSGTGIIEKEDVEFTDCFIATAAYGTPFSREVNILRSFRDNYLITNAPGRAFVHAYYALSPPIAEYISRRPGVRAGVRVVLAPAVLIAGNPHMAVFIFAFCGISACAFSFYRRNRKC